VIYHKSLRSPVVKDELDYIRKTTSFFGQISFKEGQESFENRARNIDKKPIVEFLHCTPSTSPAHKEIADMLLVSKLKIGGNTAIKRAVLIQSKFNKTKSRRWDVDTSQLYLLSKWPAFRRIRPGPSKSYLLEPMSTSWGSYAFEAPEALGKPVYLSAWRILEKNPSIFSQKTCTFNLREVNGFNMSPSFLMKLILCLVGENLNQNLRVESFVDEMYRIVGLKPDPPHEFYWGNVDNQEETGFGIVEFSVSKPERE
jgi:hypothetical protein